MKFFQLTSLNLPSTQNSSTLPFVLTLLLALASVTETQSACFDFNQKITTLLRPPSLTENKGTTKAGHDWATITGEVKLPLNEVYKKLLDPKTIRNDSNTTVEVKPLENKNYLKLIDQSISVTPVFFLTLKWHEHWAYLLKSGTPDAIKAMLILYQKTEGTTYIDHFCGNIELTEVTPQKSPPLTRVFIYEEMKADRRDAQNLLDDISGTLRTLQP